GKWLAIWVAGKIWVAPVQSDRRDVSVGKPEQFLHQVSFSPALPGRMAPAFSPDGRWLAYCLNDSEQLAVYVVPFPGPGAKWRISPVGGMFPAWSRNALDLFYQNRESNKIMVATYKASGDSFTAASPKVWSDTRLLALGLQQPFDVAPDG